MRAAEGSAAGSAGHGRTPGYGALDRLTDAGAVLVGTTRYGLYLFQPLDGGVIDGIEPGTHVTIREDQP